MLRNPSSQSKASAERANTPRLALPPLSPERAPATRPSGDGTVGPQSRLAAGAAGERIGGTGPATGGTGSTTVRSPSRKVTYWGTADAATVAGR